VTGEELKRQQIRHAADALRSLPGVSVSAVNGRAGLAQVRIRGAEGNHTLVIIDGVEANLAADGEFDFSNLLTEDIDRIEVLRGSQSALYGSGALGGVVNIITRSGKGPLTLRTRAEGGSFNTQDAAVSVSAGNDRAWGIIGLQGRRSDGFNISAVGDEEDGNAFTNFYMKGGVQIFDNLQVNGVLRQTRKDGERDAENGGLPVGSLLEQFDVANRFSTDVFLLGLEAKLSTLDDKWLHSFRFDRNVSGIRDTENNPFAANAFFIVPNTEDFESVTNRVRYTSTAIFDTRAWANSQHFLTGLVEHESDNFIYSDSQGFNNGVTRSREQTGYAAELRGEYFDNLFLTASVRHDDSNVFEDFTAWRTSGSLRIPGTVFRLHASAGTGQKAPSLFELYGRAFFSPPNPDLQPEESKGWDAGVEALLDGGNFIIDTTYFSTDLTNKIDPLWRVNLPGTATREGIEVAATWHLTPALTLAGAYTYLHAEEADGTQEIRRPEHAARLDINYGFDNGRGNVLLSTIYNGDMTDDALRIAAPYDPVWGGFFSRATVVLDDYVLMSATASYQISPGVELYGRVENLLNDDYQEVYGFETADIAAYAGLRFTYVEEATRAWAEGR
jgi:vitamin B12 transporter